MDRKELDASLELWRNRLQHELRPRNRIKEGAWKRISIAHATIERRKSQLAKIPGPRRAAVGLALRCVGTTEHPPGSNGGIAVDHWERNFHMLAKPWCGAFVGSMCNAAGAHLSDRIVFTPYIYADAKAHAHGLKGVVWERGQATHTAHSGDLVLFDFGSGEIKHVAMLVKPWHGGNVQTVEGNTSFGPGGSQDNGGAVARRSRDISLVMAIVKVDW